MQVDEQRIALIVEEVLRQLKGDLLPRLAASRARDGTFTSVDAAVKAAAARKRADGYAAQCPEENLSMPSGKRE